MGIFSIKLSTVGTIIPGKAPNPLGSGNGWFADVNGAFPPFPNSDQNLLDGITGLRVNNNFLSAEVLTAVTSSIQFGFDQDTPIFSLDGGPLISYNSLPSGFVIDSLSWLGLTGGVDIASGLTGGITINGKSVSLPQNDGINQFIINITDITSSLTISPTTLIGYSLLFALSIGAVADMSDSTFTGTYLIQSSSFILQNSTIPVKMGDKVLVTHPTSSIINETKENGLLNGVAQIQLDYTDPVTSISHTLIINTGIGILNNTNPILLTPYLMLDGIIISWVNFILILEGFLLLFYIPIGLKKYQGPITITLIGDGRKFSGSVRIGTLNVIFSDASGIYTLIDSQNYDIVYADGGKTTNLNILMLANIEDEMLEDDFFRMLSFPRRILSDSDLNEDNEYDDFFIFASLQPVIVTLNVEIPSPYIKTAFLP